MQLDGSATLAVPAEHGVMREHHARAVALAGPELEVVEHGFEGSVSGRGGRRAHRRAVPSLRAGPAVTGDIARRRLQQAPIFVVVATDEAHMLAIDALAQAQRLGHGGAIREVAQHVQRIAAAYAVIDGRDKPRVHLLDGVERTLVAAEDVAMSEMGVGGEPDHVRVLSELGNRRSVHLKARPPSSSHEDGGARKDIEAYKLN